MLMNLSLFIMLLAFFIVLNAISSFIVEKTYPIVQSVQLTFSTQALRPDILPSVAPDVRESIRDGTTVERLDALFKSQITAYDAVKDADTGQMETTLPLDVFSTSVMAIGQEDLMTASPDVQVKGKKFFLPTLASILKSDAQGVPYRMDMILHAEDNPAHLQNQDPKTLAQVTERASQLAAQLEKAGVPQKMMSVGVAKGDPDTIRIIFRPHKPFSPVDPEAEKKP